MRILDPRSGPILRALRPGGCPRRWLACRHNGSVPIYRQAHPFLREVISLVTVRADNVLLGARVAVAPSVKDVWVLLLVGLTAAPIFSAESAEAPRRMAAESSRRPMPVIAERHYRMLAKVRPLLFWIARDNVGGARIRWRSDSDGGQGFELLIGSDPGRAPRRINRWGYIAEEVRASQSSTLGVMKQSIEESIEEAEAQVRREADGMHAFKVIRATSENGKATSGVSTLNTEDDFTYRDVDSLLANLDTASIETSVRIVELPAGTRPGFLIALADLIHQPDLKSVPYVYNGRFHQLSRRGTISVSSRVNGRDVTTLRSARFETENPATRVRTAFDITYGTSGDLAGVPVHILYQPKWWFQVELFLEDKATM